MRSLTLYLLFFLSTIAVTQTQAQKRSIDVSTFSELSFGISGTLYLKQGNTQSVEIECSDDVFEKIDFRSSGDRLIIESRSNWGWSASKSNVTIYITMTEIEIIGLSGSGQLIGEQKIETEDLKLSISGSGSMSIEASASNLSTEISGSGKMMLAGRADNMRARISGSGSIKGEDMTVNAVDASISGSGNVYVTVNEEIKARISGSGSVYYKGDPQRRDSDSSGSGKIRKME